MSRLDGKESSMFLILLDRANSVGWKNPFPVSTRSLANDLNVAQSTVIAIRNRLKEKGIIDFQEGKRNLESPRYCLPEKAADGTVFFPWDDTPIGPVAGIESLRKEAAEQAEKIREDMNRNSQSVESMALKHNTTVEEILKVVNYILDDWIAGGKVHNTNGQFNLGEATMHLRNRVRTELQSASRYKESLTKPNNQSRYEDKYSRRRGTEPQRKSNADFNTTF